jgi:hypothetical protein
MHLRLFLEIWVVYSGSAYTGFPPGVVGPPGVIHAGDVSAQNAQAANTATFTSLDQGCDVTYAGTQDLVGFNLVPGVYCANAFALSGTLTLSGSGVWIFKSASSLITSGTAKVVGGDPCNVWWRVVSSATLGTNTSLIGNILASTSISLQTGAILNGRALAQTGAVTMDSNTISGPTCASTTSSSSSSNNISSGTEIPYCPPIANTIITPIIIESKRVDKDSIYIKWGPYSGTDKFNVQYGTENGKWLYNVDVTGFSTTIKALPTNQPIWVRVAARNDCQIGTYGESKFVGSPKLPNTGFAPEKSNLLIFLNQIKNWFL